MHLSPPPPNFLVHFTSLVTLTGLESEKLNKSNYSSLTRFLVNVGFSVSLFGCFYFSVLVYL